MKKKVVSVILAMTMVASMAMGCGSSSDTTTSDNSTTTSDAAASTEASDAADATAAIIPAVVPFTRKYVSSAPKSSAAS